MKKGLSLILIFFALSLFFIGCGASKIKKYSVNFETYGGTQISTQLLENGEFATKPSDPTKEGCTFGGWFEDENFSSVFDFDTHAVSSNTTIYAKFNRIEMQVNFAQMIGDGFKFITDSTSFYYGDDYSFKLLISSDYSKSNPIISLNGVTPTQKSKATLTSGENAGKIEYIYTFENLKSGGNIILNGVQVNRYSVNLPDISEQVGYSISASSNSILHNSAVTLTFNLNENCSQSQNKLKIVVNDDAFTYSDLTNGSTLTIKNVTEDLVIYVIGVEINKFSISELPSSTAALVSEYIEGVSAGFAESGSNVVVSATLNKHYCTRSNLALNFSNSLGSYALNPVSENTSADGSKTYTFIIENVQSNITNLSFSGVLPNIYTVNIPSGQVGFSLEVFGSARVTYNYGENLSINLVKNDSYDYSSATLRCFGTESTICNINLNEVSSPYKFDINGIDQDINFEISGVTPITYSYSFEPDSSNRYSITPVSTLINGEILKASTFLFRVDFIEGYEAKAGFKVYANGVELNSNGFNQYSVQNVQDNIEIVATPEYVGKIEYSISYPEEAYVNIGGYQGALKTIVEHSDAFEFTLSIHNYYSQSFNSFTLAINGVLLNNASGLEECISSAEVIATDSLNLEKTYRISGVKSNIEISVVGLEKNRVTATLNSEPLNTAYSEFSFAENSAPYIYDYYSFTITLNFGYEQSNVLVSYTFTGGEKQAIIPASVVNSNNQKILTYSIYIENSDFDIEVENISLNTYNITLSQNSYYSIELISDVSQNASFEYVSNNYYSFTHGSNVLFRIIVEEAYSQSDYELFVKNLSSEDVSYVSVSEENTYKVVAPTESLNIYAQNFELNEYTVNFYFCTQAEYNSNMEPALSTTVYHGQDLSYVYLENEYIYSTSWVSADSSINSITCDCSFVLNSFGYVGYNISIFDLGSMDNASILTLTYNDFGLTYNNFSANHLDYYSLQNYIQKYNTPAYSGLTFKGLYIQNFDALEELDNEDIEALEEFTPGKTYLIKYDENSGTFIGNGIPFDNFTSFDMVFAEFEISNPTEEVATQNANGEIIVVYNSGSQYAQLYYNWCFYENNNGNETFEHIEGTTLQDQSLNLASLGYESGTYDVVCLVYSQIFQGFKYVKTIIDNEIGFEITPVFATSEIIVVASAVNGNVITPYQVVIN